MHSRVHYGAAMLALSTAWPCVCASAGIVADEHSLGLVCPETREDTLTETQATRGERLANRAQLRSVLLQLAASLIETTSTSPVS